MRGKKAKQIRKLLAAKEPILLMTIRQEYGEKTKEMGLREIYHAAKRLYKRGEINDLIASTRGIRNLSTLRRG
jgi:hypothetical protein